MRIQFGRRREFEDVGGNDLGDDCPGPASCRLRRVARMRSSRSLPQMGRGRDRLAAGLGGAPQQPRPRRRSRPAFAEAPGEAGARSRPFGRLREEGALPLWVLGVFRAASRSGEDAGRRVFLQGGLHRGLAQAPLPQGSTRGVEVKRALALSVR